jgi:protein-serine/threonine kinase
MDPNRFHINFPRGQGPNHQAHDNEQRGPGTDSPRMYPTTPSTFPQPVYPQQQGQHQGFLNNQIRTPQTSDYPQSAGGGGGGGYFPNTQQYQGQQSQYGQPPSQQQPSQQQQQFQQPSVPSNQPYNNFNQNDPTAGLATQFQNQNLGGSQPRQPSPFGRQGSPAGLPARPRPAAQPNQANYGNFLTPSGPAPEQQQQAPSQDEVPPEQDYDRFSGNVGKRVIGLHVHVQSFFKDNITRARERNVR